MTSKTRHARDDGFAPLILLALAAVLVGVFVLPRFGRGLEGKAAPDFALPVVFGGEQNARVRLSEQRGKLVLLDFWASWCGPCRAQSKVLASLQKRLGNDALTVIGVNVSDSSDAAQRYLQAEKPPWIVLEDDEGEAHAAYRVQELPTLVAIDREGKVFAVRRRFMPESELIALLEAMRKGS